MENFVELYNPAKSSKLTEEQVAAMKDLTNDQLEQLAKAYPNQPTGNAYLKLYNTNEKLQEQKYPLSTWRNLSNLRKLGRNEFVAISFSKSRYQAPVVNSGTAKPSRVVDLKKNEKIEGLKDGAAEEVKVPAAALEGTSEAVKVFNAIQKELVNAREEKAHPQTIKKLEKRLAAAREAVEAESK